MRALALVLTAGLAACGGGGGGSSSQGAGAPPVAQAGPPPIVADVAASPVRIAYQEIATGLAFPWGIAFLPNGDALVTERDGRLRVIRAGRLDPAPVTGMPPVFAEGQGGLFDVVLDPDFASNQRIYLSFAHGTSAANGTRIVRARFDGRALSEVTPIFTASPLKHGAAHFGGRMAILPDRSLVLTLGEGYAFKDDAQKLDNDFGKIVRLTLDGQPAPGNPYIGQSGQRAEIWSYGHRNVQGIVHDPATGVLWAHEHGPKGGDELNIIRPGVNYGWPTITYGVDYSGAIISPFTSRDGMEQPQAVWVPSIAPSGMIQYRGSLFALWRGDLIISALAGMQARRVDLEGARVVGQEKLFADLNARIRQVAEAPDGSIWLLIDSPDGKVIRATPR
jgi:glucose/arabinose dehydrogenase